LKREFIEVELTPRQRVLIIRYGYPFERIRSAIEVCNVGSIEVVPLDEFGLELEHHFQERPVVVVVLCWCYSV